MKEQWFSPEQQGDDLATAVTGMVSALNADYGDTRRRRMDVWRSIYMDEANSDYGGYGYHRGRLSRYPVTHGGVDSLHAKLTLSRPRPKIMPTSRRFKAKRQAKGLQKYIDGEWLGLNTAQMQDDQLHDAELYGTGVIKVLVEHGRLKHQRSHPGDLLTDPREERQHSVRSLFEQRGVDRDVLMESDLVDGSDTRRRLEDVVASMDDDETLPQNISATLDQLRVVEAWRLPNSPDRPGRHVIAVGDITLVDEDWLWDVFPFSFLVWGRDPERMWGKGLVERGAGIQSMLNRHAETIEKAFSRFVPKYGVARGSNVDTDVIDSTVAQVVEYDNVPTGGPPTVLSPGPISPDFFAYSETLRDRWYGTTGVSQMEARSETDRNLQSGKAIQVQSDVTSGRFYVQGKARERACITLAELSLRICGELHDEGEAQEVKAGKKGYREKVLYSESHMEDDDYDVEVWPVSALSQSVAGRMDEVAQLTEAGYITDPDQARELLDIPQLDEFQNLASARREAAEQQIDMCLDGKQGTASAYMDLPHAVERGTVELNLAVTDGADEDAPEAVEMLRKFIGFSEHLLKLQMEPPAPPAGPAVVPPLGPEPTPVDIPPAPIPEVA